MVSAFHRDDDFDQLEFKYDPTGKPDVSSSRTQKRDHGKPPMALLSGRWLRGVAEVLAFGAAKYEPDGYRKTNHTQRQMLGAALRHITAYADGEDKDTESGLNHLDHAACCLMMLMDVAPEHPELDDRFKRKP